MDDLYLIWCGSDDPPKGAGKQFKRVIELDTYPKKGNVNLKFENISRRLAQNIPSIAKDFLEIGSYVYCADQAVPRGGLTWPKNGKTWIRSFVFEIPVRNPEIWNSPEVKDTLTNTLSYLSDDN